jgi:glycosyltransferase involved in cell wall biosynthesis
VCPNLEAGGAERQWATLVPGLRRRGLDVRVLTLDGRGPYFDALRATDTPLVCAGLRNRADPVGLARVVRLAGSGFSVVVTRGVSAHLVGHVLASTHGAAHVATEHLGPDPLGMRALRRHQELLLRPMRPRVCAVVAVAASQRDHLVRDGYPPGAIRVIRSGVRSDPPVRDRDGVRRELGVAGGAFLAVLVATLRPEKRVMSFVDQVVAAHAAHPAVHGLVVGNGPDAVSVRRATAASGGVVGMTGYRADSLDIMHAADVVCLTSAVEALPMSVLEAMSVGRPVVATGVGDVADVVVDGRTGRVVAPGDPSGVADAIVELARNRPQAEAMGHAGRERQQRRFSIEAMTCCYADLLEGIGWR